jgi:hypothetical protein
VRHEHTDPGQDTQDTMIARTDGWSPERARAAAIARPDQAVDVEVDEAVHDQRSGRRGAAMPGGTSSWQGIKSQFVDDPAGAVAAAEQLVQQAVEDRIRAIKQEVEQMCERDDAGDGDGLRGDASSTEVLRTKLLRYQEYCERLAGSSTH